MRELERNMEMVESIKAFHAMSRQRNRRAASIAAVSGFAAGWLCAMLMPYLEHVSTVWRGAVSDSAGIPFLADTPTLLMWMIAAAMAAGAAMQSYKLSLSLLKRGDRK